MIHSTSLFQLSRKSSPQWNDLDLPRHEIIQWGLLIALPMVGILLLLVCFLLHGIFAALGPWLIFVGVKLMTKSIERKPIMVTYWVVFQ